MLKGLPSKTLDLVHGVFCSAFGVVAEHESGCAELVPGYECRSIDEHLKQWRSIRGQDALTL